VIGNTLLDSVIAQAQKRNAEIQAQNQARIASLPTSAASVAPIVNPILDNLAGGDGMQQNTPYTPMTNQQQYDAAAKFKSIPMAARVIMPGGLIGTAAANYAMNQAAKDPSVVTDLRVGDPVAPKSAKSWAKAQPELAEKEINPAWNAMRAKFMNAEAKAEQDRADINGMGGFGGVQQGMTAANFGETAGDFFDTAVNVVTDDGGGDDGFGDADAMGGDMDASSFGYGDDGDFGGYA